jgi:hypothetical protein
MGVPLIEWQPIATAPKDGSCVLAWRADWERPVWIRWVFNHRVGRASWNGADEWGAYDLQDEPPTHWLQLPPPPQCDGVGSS